MLMCNRSKCCRQRNRHVSTRVCVCVNVTNLHSLVSRGSGKKAAVWRDMTGQNGSHMSVDVPHCLSTFYVPHLRARNETVLNI